MVVMVERSVVKYLSLHDKPQAPDFSDNQPNKLLSNNVPHKMGIK